MSEITVNVDPENIPVVQIVVDENSAQAAMDAAAAAEAALDEISNTDFGDKLDKGGYVGTAQDLKNDIDAISPDGVVKEGIISMAGLNASIAAEDFEWRINHIIYKNLTLFTDTLPATTTGYMRTDIFEGDDNGNIFRKQGNEAIGASLKPSVTDGRIELGSIDIENSTAGTPVIPKPKYAVSQQLRDGETGYSPSENVVYDALALKLNASDYNQHFKGVYLTEASLITAHPTASVGDYAQVNEVGATDVVNYNWDNEDGVWVVNVVAGSGATNTDALPEGSTNLYFTVARFLANLTYANVISALGFTPSTAPNNAQKNSDITKAEIEAKLVGEITTHTHPAVGGGGDMVLASVQTVSELKTFLAGKLGFRNVANTFTSFFTNANTAARTYTLQNRDGTLLDNTDLSTINTNIATKMANPSGTANYLSKFLTATTIGLSRLWDTGTFLGIGTVNAPTKDLTLGNDANKEIGVEESGNTTTGRDLSVKAGRTTNFVPSANFVSLSQTSRAWVGLSSYNSNDIYATDATSSSCMYKQTGGTGNFVSYGSVANLLSIAVHPNGNIYGITYGGDVYKQTGGTGAFNFLATVGGGGAWYTMCAAPNGNVYIAKNGGDVYMQTGGTGSFTALSQGNRNWHGIKADASNNIFSTVNGGDIYKQTGGTGSFVALGQTSRNWKGITCAANGNNYAVVYNGDIYMQTSGVGNFIALGQTSRSWTDIQAVLNGNIYATVEGGDIYIQNNSGAGTSNLNGGTLKLASGTGKGTGTSRIQFITGAKASSGTDMQAETVRGEVDENGYFKWLTMPTYADNTAALAGGLVAGQFYRTSAGILMITY